MILWRDTVLSLRQRVKGMTVKMFSNPVTKRYTNISTENSFQFIFHCDRCGAGVKSERFFFNTEDFDPPLRDQALAFLWTKWHDAAFERANSEAKFDFNLCVCCGRRVCEICFDSSEETICGKCIDCIKKDERRAVVKRKTGRKKRNLQILVLDKRKSTICEK